MHLENDYFIHVKHFIKNNTPIPFIVDEQRFNEININLSQLNIQSSEKVLISSCYTLLYTALNYHLSIKDQIQYKSYYILVGDYITSYVSEMLYKNRLFDLLNIFIIHNKRIALESIDGQSRDTFLLDDIMNYYKQVS